MGDDVPDRTNILSRQYINYLEMHEVSYRLQDTMTIMTYALAVLNSEEATTKRKNEATAILERSIIPFMDVPSIMSRKSAIEVSPIAGGAYAHNRNEVRRKKEIMIQSRAPNPKSGLNGSILDSVDEFVQHGMITPDKCPRVAEQVQRKSTRKWRLIPPVPYKDGVYGIGEFLGHITKYRKGTRDRKEMINCMIELGYVTPSYVTACKIIKDHEEKGKVFEFASHWRETGRPKIMEDSEVDEMVRNIKSTVGKKNTKDIISKKLLEVMRKKGSLSDTVNPTTVNNYMAYTASKNGVSLIGKSIPNSAPTTSS